MKVFWLLLFSLSGAAQTPDSLKTNDLEQVVVTATRSERENKSSQNTFMVSK